METTETTASTTVKFDVEDFINTVRLEVLL